MFRERVLTALALIPLVFLAIYYANPKVLSILILVLFLFLSWEWLPLIPVKNLTNKLLLMLVILAAFLINLQFTAVFLYINFLFGLQLP